MDRNACVLLALGGLVRLAFFCYGIYQDSHFAVKYTDIDYHVFHDAGGFAYAGQSPYLRDTYRYTPLLSWLFMANHYFGRFHLVKLVFVVFDVLTGAAILRLLPRRMPSLTRCKVASLWLLNPMVITISTRGNAETVLCFLVVLVVLALKNKHYFVASLLFGLSIHLKIYPIVYALPIAVYLFASLQGYHRYVVVFNVGLTTLITVLSLNVLMFQRYGFEFLDQTYLYHVYRFDHRHNFSLWNQLLYFDSAATQGGASSSLAKYAFAPQLAIVALIGAYFLWVPEFSHAVHKRSRHIRLLCNVLFLQTFAFVTFNKVCTSQYFIWYMVFLPTYAAGTGLSWCRLGTMLAVWVGAQAAWLNEGYRLEFLGKNVFWPGLFAGNVLFFLGNTWILGQLIADVRAQCANAPGKAKGKAKGKTKAKAKAAQETHAKE